MNFNIDYLCTSNYNGVGKVRFDFKDQDLLMLYTTGANTRRYPPGVVDAFFDVMAIIAASTNELDIRVFKSLHYEKLSGNRSHQHSLRLNKQYRLIIEISRDKLGKVIWVIEIIDYH